MNYGGPFPADDRPVMWRVLLRAPRTEETRFTIVNARLGVTADQVAAHIMTDPHWQHWTVVRVGGMDPKEWEDVRGA
jgi:hypothetical protein